MQALGSSLARPGLLQPPVNAGSRNSPCTRDQRGQSRANHSLTRVFIQDAPNNGLFKPHSSQWPLIAPRYVHCFISFSLVSAIVTFLLYLSFCLAVFTSSSWLRRCSLFETKYYLCFYNIHPPLSSYLARNFHSILLSACLFDYEMDTVQLLWRRDDVPAPSTNTSQQFLDLFSNPFQTQVNMTHRSLCRDER